MRTRREWTRKEEESAAALRRSGLKIAAVARRLDRPEMSVKRKLVRLRVVVEPFKAARRGRGKLLAAVRELSRAGRTVGEIAERLGVDPSAVSRARKKLGHPPTPHADRARRGWEWRKRRAA